MSADVSEVARCDTDAAQSDKIDTARQMRLRSSAWRIPIRSLHERVDSVIIRARELTNVVIEKREPTSSRKNGNIQSCTVVCKVSVSATISA